MQVSYRSLVAQSVNHAGTSSVISVVADFDPMGNPAGPFIIGVRSLLELYGGPINKQADIMWAVVGPGTANGFLK